MAKTALVGAEASTKVTLFTNDEFGTVRTTVINGEPWFVGKDVAEALGYRDTSDAMKKHVDDDDRGVQNMDTQGAFHHISHEYSEVSA